MKKSDACVLVLGCALAVFSPLLAKTAGQDRGQQFDQRQTNEATVEGPAVQMLVTERLPGRDVRKLVTSSRTVHAHSNLAEYYRQEAQRLQAESKEYERLARSAGDTTPLSEPNHYGISRSARFDYIVARDNLRKAQDANLLAALNAQAARQEGCFTCHSFHGSGGKIGPDLAVEGTRKRSDAWLIEHFKDPQADSPNSAMPTFGHLTGRQLEVLSTFLQYQK